MWDNPRALRPHALGTQFAVSSGHPQATLAAVNVLAAGGNAMDAAAAGGICLAVAHPDIVNFAGVAAIIYYDATHKKAITISGLGPWPRRAELDYFQSVCRGTIPDGLARCVVPGAPDAWITALERYGTLGFAEVAASAIELARLGCPASEFVAANIERYKSALGSMPSSSKLFLPGGIPPAVGQRLQFPQLGATLSFLADEDRANRRSGRHSGLAAVRKAFYRGDIARAIDRFHAENDGLLTREDLAQFRVTVDTAPQTEFLGHKIATCGFWCQGPVLLQALNILSAINFSQFALNSPNYVHYVVEAIKLAMADRHGYYGDPLHVSIPVDGLLNPRYGAQRASLIDHNGAWPDMPPAGDPRTFSAIASTTAARGESSCDGPPARNTSTIAVVDKDGNACAATVSDVAVDTPVVPALGFPVSSRGGQGWLDPGHPGVVRPGRRPWLTASPALLFRNGEAIMPICCAGGDTQPQAMLQVLLNHLLFNLDPQAAIDAPRFESRSFPDAFWPHDYEAGRLNVEQEIGDRAADELTGRGHRVTLVPARDWRSGSVTLVRIDHNGLRWGAADTRRDATAIGY
jgi:gamma-glutamyltranspeptidase / glutathione hydrolase